MPMTMQEAYLELEKRFPGKIDHISEFNDFPRTKHSSGEEYKIVKGKNYHSYYADFASWETVVKAVSQTLAPKSPFGLDFDLPESSSKFGAIANSPLDSSPGI